MSYPTDNTAITQIVDGAGYPRATNVNPAFSDLDGVKTMLGVNGIGWIGEGQMYNGKLSVTVSANDLIVAIKTLAGNNPSASEPVYVRINGTIRKITAALSKTLADGTNWFNAGSAELATKEVDYFAYLIWNTTPATDIVDLGFARKPHYTVYSEVSATATSENYLATSNASAPTSTDDMVNIGRFAATLSAGAGYTWTVPTFTTTNLIQRPCFESRWLSYQPAYSANGSMTFTTVTTNKAVYQIRERNCHAWVNASGTTGGTASSLLLATVPFDALYSANQPSGFGRTNDSATVAANVFVAAGTPDTIACGKYDTSNYALAAGKTMNIGVIYEI
jgi:hypothetical protein